MKNQHFWLKSNFFDLSLTWNSHSRTRILFDAPTSPTSTPNQHLEEKSTCVRLLFHRIDILAQGFSVKVPIANVIAKSTFWLKIVTFSMGGLVLVFGWSWGGLGVVLGWWRVDEGSMKGSMKGRWRIDDSNRENKQRKKTQNPKKQPYIKNYTTPDRPPPAAAMLAIVYLN